MLLKVVSNAGNVRVHFKTAGQFDTGHFSQGGIGFFRRGGEDSGAYSPSLRASRQSGRLGLDFLNTPFLANQLMRRRHGGKLVGFKSPVNIFLPGPSVPPTACPSRGVRHSYIFVPEKVPFCLEDIPLFLNAPAVEGRV